MKSGLSKIFYLLSFCFKAISTQSDYKNLTQYIIQLNEQKSVNSIITLLCECLKKILDYKLFAFSIKIFGKMNVWLDPRIYKEAIEKIIIKDFKLKDNTKINYLNNKSFFDDYKTDIKLHFSLENLISYEFYEKNCQTKIYILPKNNTAKYNDELIEMLIKSASIALFKQIRIENLKNIANIDSLTGCYNRGEFDKQLARHVYLAKKYKEKFTIFMFDIDHFKKVNDIYGHQAGDDVLKVVTTIVRNNIRKEDMFARYGGEEFVVILPSTGKCEGLKLAKRLRKKIEKKVIKTQNNQITVTASFGVASFMPFLNKSQIVKNADLMMYKAKLYGRNLAIAYYFHR